MAHRLRLDGSNGPQELPPVDDFAIVPDRRHITAAFSTRGEDGSRSIVLVHIPKSMASEFSAELTQHLADGRRSTDP
jgi:hypothetical protein